MALQNIFPYLHIATNKKKEVILSFRKKVKKKKEACNRKPLFFTYISKIALQRTAKTFEIAAA
jgi:hypothetical protein